MAHIEEIDATEAATALQQDDRLVLLDVRDPWEVEVAHLPGAVVIPLSELPDRTGELDPDRPVIAFCHGGVRSLRAAQVLQRAGFDVRSVRGGIDAWSRTVDPAVPRY